MVEVKRFWCILLDDGPNEPFLVNVGLDQLVFNLKGMIKSSLNRMRQYDAQDIPLYKLTKSIPISPTRTLFQRIQDIGDIHSFASEVDDTSEGLSDVFPNGVADRILHFIVKFPQTPDSGPPSKRARVTSPEATEPRPLQAGGGNRQDQVMYLLYHRLWKKGVKAWAEISRVVKGRVPDPSVALGEVQEGDLDTPEEVQVTIVDLTSLLKWTREDTILDPLTPILLVRDEYTELEKFSESCSKHVLLLGQPGIGKTIYLTYCLLRRLTAGLPTIFSKRPRNRYIFLDSGVYWIPNDSFEMSRQPPFTNPVKNNLALFDLNEDQPKTERFGDWIILSSSSPRTERYKEWVKVRDVECWVMRPWSWEEIYMVWLTSQTAKKYSLQGLFTAFCKYGGTARNLFDKDPARVEEGITNAIKNCTDFSTLFPASTDFHDATSHALITINPKVDDAGVLQRWAFRGRVTSKYILDMLLVMKDRQFAEGMKETLKMLLRAPSTRSTGGILFEDRGHPYLLTSFKSPLTIRPLSTDGDHGLVNLEHVAGHRFFKDLSVSFKDLDAKRYYQPLSPTTPGIDSFALEVNKEGVPISVVSFQFTVTEDHPINPSFLSKLWNKGERVPKEGPKWKLVFIVPLEIESTFKAQMWKSDGNMWSRRVSQYVFGVDINELFIQPQLLSPSGVV